MQFARKFVHYAFTILALIGLASLNVNACGTISHFGNVYLGATGSNLSEIKKIQCQRFMLLNMACLTDDQLLGASKIMAAVLNNAENNSDVGLRCAAKELLTGPAKLGKFANQSLRKYRLSPKKMKKMVDQTTKSFKENDCRDYSIDKVTARRIKRCYLAPIRTSTFGTQVDCTREDNRNSFGCVVKRFQSDIERATTELQTLREETGSRVTQSKRVERAYDNLQYILMRGAEKISPNGELMRALDEHRSLASDEHSRLRSHSDGRLRELAYHHFERLLNELTELRRRLIRNYQEAFRVRRNLESGKEYIVLSIQIADYARAQAVLTEGVNLVADWLSRIQHTLANQNTPLADRR